MTDTNPMREALAFYADDANWHRNGPLDPNSANFTGGPARAALAAAPQTASKESTRSENQLWADIYGDIPNDMTTEERAAYAGILMAQSLAHRTATDAGWYRDPKTGAPVERNFGEVVALMHSELSEALEADRKGLMDDNLPHRDGREVEFADCIIRILDTAAALGLDVAGAIIEKNRFNKTRADHSLSARANNGKRY